MSKNWAIVIGINRYNPNNFTSLKYAKRDAELMRVFFQEAKFDEVCLFTDDSPDLRLPNGSMNHTRPTLGNLRSFLHDRFDAKPFLSTGDNCWFFFAGHGGQYAGRDYLMPQDANPRDIEHTAIPVSYVRERLCRSGADNVILILDACRSEGSRSSLGIGNEPQQGVITISACSPTQRSWEVDQLRQGIFTYALHEAFKNQSRLNCATVEKLDRFLRSQVPELCRHYKKLPEQNPRIAIDPIEKAHLILLPAYVTSTGCAIPQADVTTLKEDIYRLAFMENQIDLAEQLCIRVVAAAMGRDLEVLKLYGKLKELQAKNNASSSPKPTNENLGGRNVTQTRLPTQLTSPQLPTDDLRSEKGVNYTKLRDTLRSGQWKQADWETSNVMRQIAGRTIDRWLRVKDIADFPQQDLQTIDQLWMKYSNGKFGFSAQKKIWKACGSPRGYGENWDRFVDAVAWAKDGASNRYGHSLNVLEAPPGHFPRDFAFTTSTGGTAKGREASPVSLTAKLLSRLF